MSPVLADATFLRPLALGLLLLLPLVYRVFQRRAGHGANPWRALVDEPLIPALFPDAAPSARSGRPRAITLAACLAWVLITLALAGPSLRQAEVPTVAPRTEAVIVLGLPASMLAQDLTPDRLTRSRIAIEEWLQAREGDEIGLVAFAGSAYRVSPLTRDTQTLQHLLHSLRPDVMPRPGNDIASGIDAATALYSHGPGQRTLLLVTDGSISTDAQKTLGRLAREGYAVQVMGVGTPNGAPIPLANGRFATQRNGQLELASTDLRQQKKTVQRLGGKWVDVREYNAELWQAQAGGTAMNSTEDGLRSSVPQDDGIWLLLPLLVIVALGFRRGALWVLLAGCLPLFQPGNASAAEIPDWLLNENQRAVRAWQENPSAETAEAIPDRQWRGVAEFTDGDFAAAEQRFAAGDSIDDRYNRALTMAHQDRLDDAIEGFRQVLEEQPDFAAARQNLELLEQVRKQQQEQQESDGESSEQGDSSENDNSEGSESSDSGEQGEDSGQPTDGEQQASSDPTQSATDDANPQDAQAQESAQEEPADADERADTDGEPEPGENDTPTEAESASLTASPSEQEEAERTLRQWLRRVDSDPARLLRERFRRLEIERQRGAHAQDDGR